MAEDTTAQHWDTDAYDDEHGFVADYGTALLDILDPQPDERILDLGCGTGQLTADIAAQAGSVVGIDSAATMVQEASETYPDCSFVQADARTFTVSRPFDAVFSNAVLHWIPDTDQGAVLETVSDALRPGGRFVLEFGGTGNVDRIVTALRDELAARGYGVPTPWYFPSIGEYTPRLEAHGFEVRQAVLFDRPTPLEGSDGLRNWVSMFGDRFFAACTAETQADVIAAVEDRLREDLFDPVADEWRADYRRLRVVAVKQPTG